MSVKKESFGKTKQGTETFLYTIENKNGMKAKVTNFGAILVALYAPDQNGQMKDVVLGYDKIEDYENNGSFFGTTVGRNANRIADAKFEIDGVTYQLAVNDGKNNLHSDADHGFHKCIWAAEPAQQSVKFTYVSKDGELGFPGTLRISVTYTLTDENAIEIHYDGISDKKTVINMTNHSYFNLSGHDADKIYDTKLMLACSHYTPVVPGAIPTGEIAPVAGTAMDFLTAKRIGDQINDNWDQLTMVQGYDHNWVIDQYDGTMRKIAVATDEKAKRTMEVYTDLPGVQFYAGN
ncbi:MAG: galactose mutarotase, partial [Clostridia bacterium]|nr:galactose mutarotase [Clostridia bacterium]